MTYVVVAVAAVPTARRAEYEAHSTMAAGVFLEHGAERIVELWGDDVPDGEVTSFPMAVKAGSDETVAVSLMYWPDRAARDRGMERIFADARMQAPMPFDGKRMIFASFETMLDREKAPAS
ncbi:MAG: DUF1428 domain-containing protein [Paracoccaceae bacterium]